MSAKSTLFPAPVGPMIGAGEGNRTLVISLEGDCRAGRHNSLSDKTPPIVGIDHQRVFGPVRTAEPVLPMVQRARERDATARLRLLTGENSDSEPDADFARKIRTAELSRGGRRR